MVLIIRAKMLSSLSFQSPLRDRLSTHISDICILFLLSLFDVSAFRLSPKKQSRLSLRKGKRLHANASGDSLPQMLYLAEILILTNQALGF